MGFLQWLAGNQEEPEASQMELFGGSQALAPHERVDGATVRKDLTNTIQGKGGSLKAHRDATIAMSKELFDMKPNELYDATGGKRNDRSTLPKEAQKAFIVGETVANHDLKAKNISGNQAATGQTDYQLCSRFRQKGKGLVSLVSKKGKPHPDPYASQSGLSCSI